MEGEFFMAKYSFEFKTNVVQAYLDGEGSYGYLTKKYGIPRSEQVHRWVKSYGNMGNEGLIGSEKKENYSFDFKLHVVEFYLTTEASYQELALSIGMNNPPLITKWVNDFRIAGPDALRSKRKGRKRTMNKPKTKASSTDTLDPSNHNEKYIKQLEDELLKLFKRTEETTFRGNTSEQKARIIHSLRGSFKLKDILAITGFPKATYMYWQKRFDKENPNQKLEEKILEIRKNNKDFGYRRIYGELKKQGLVVNKKRVQRIIQKLGLQVTSFTRKSRKYSSYKGKVGKVAPNRIHRRFNTCVPHQKITTDTSEFKYYEVDETGKMHIKKLYLDPFMDLCNREIISYSISQRPSAVSIMQALNKAIEITANCKYRRTFHSDQG